MWWSWTAQRDARPRRKIRETFFFFSLFSRQQRLRCSPLENSSCIPRMNMHRRFFGRCIVPAPARENTRSYSIRKRSRRGSHLHKLWVTSTLSGPSVNPFAVELVARAFSLEKMLERVRITRKQICRFLRNKWYVKETRDFGNGT